MKFDRLCAIDCVRRPRLQVGTPTRDPSNPNYPRATDLPDGALPPAGAEGNFIIRPTHAPAPATIVREGVPKGTVTSFNASKECVSTTPAIVTTSHPGT